MPPPRTTLYSLSGEAIPLSFSLTTASFVQPAVNASVEVEVDDTAWMGAQQALFVEVGGYYRLDAILSGVRIRLVNLGTDPPNATPGTTIPASSVVNGGGEPGPEGPEGPTGPTGPAPESTTTDDSDPFAWPNNGEPVFVAVDTLAWMRVGAPVYVTDGTNGGTLVVTELDGPFPGWVTLSNDFDSGPAGGTEMGISTITPGGERGPTGATGATGATGIIQAGSVDYATNNPFVTISDPGCTTSSVHVATLTHATVPAGSFEVLEGTDSFRVYSSQQLFDGKVNWARVKT